MTFNKARRRSGPLLALLAGVAAVIPTEGVECSDLYAKPDGMGGLWVYPVADVFAISPVMAPIRNARTSKSPTSWRWAQAGERRR